MLAVQWPERLHESSLPSEAHSATDADLESNIDLFSYTYPLPRPQGAGEGSAHLARGGAAVPMPKQAQSHQGAPREYPEKNGPRGLRALLYLSVVGKAWRCSSAILTELLSFNAPECCTFSCSSKWYTRCKARFLQVP
jgi:hypothetical protein